MMSLFYNTANRGFSNRQLFLFSDNIISFIKFDNVYPLITVTINPFCYISLPYSEQTHYIKLNMKLNKKFLINNLKEF